MASSKFNIEIGNGIYTVPDLALILRLPQSKVRRWLTDFYDQRLANDKVKYSWGEGKSRATNFLTLIEFYIFYMLREHKIGAGKILEAHQQMSKLLKTRYPFASHNLLVNKKDILYQIGLDTWVHADKTNQIVIHKLIQEFSKKIDFSKDSMATRFWPLGKDHSIVVDPHHQFGQPIIHGTNINAANIYSMYQSGEPLSTIGILYDLTEEQVNDAIAFCKRTAA